MKITPQSEQYGLPEREARSLPDKAEVKGLLRGRGITPGLMKRAISDDISPGEGESEYVHLPPDQDRLHEWLRHVPGTPEYEEFQKSRR